MGLFKKLTGRTGLKPVSDVVPEGDSKPSPRQIYRYRFNHGPNIGALFVLEKWISHGLYDFGGASDSSELAAVTASVKKNGIEASRKAWEEHWRSWVSDDDWKWMQDQGVTAVRVPIGYWMVGGARFNGGTAFDKYSDVYVNAWHIFKDVILNKALEHNIGVLVDVHGLPGGANGNDHSGTNSGKAQLFGSSRNEATAFKVYEFIAKDLKGFDNLVGLQLVNEAEYSNGKEQRKFYEEAIRHVRDGAPDLPVVISDSWDLSGCITYVKNEQKDHADPLGVVIDTHVYRCFSDQDKNKAVEQLVHEAQDCIPQEDEVDIMVGEFSCVMDGQSWSKFGGSGDQKQQVVSEYGNVQCRHFYDRARAGVYFWTFKFQVGSGGEWGFREMIERGCVSRFSNRHGNANDQYDQRKRDAVESHTSYWNGVDGKRDWQHWRFEAGFDQGWADAQAFDEFNHSEIGSLATWTRARQAQHVRAKGDSDVAWVYGHGLQQGCRAYVEAT